MVELILTGERGVWYHNAAWGIPQAEYTSETALAGDTVPATIIAYDVPHGTSMRLSFA